MCRAAGHIGDERWTTNVSARGVERAATTSAALAHASDKCGERDVTRAASRGGAVDPRTTSVVDSSIRSASTRWPSSSRIRRLTPVRPSSCSGCRTVVSCGHTILDWNVSSKPTIDRSSGTRSPRRRAALSAPIATLSLKPKIAVGGSGCDSSSSAASLAAADLPVGVPDQLRVGEDARARERRSEPDQPLLGGVPPFGAGERGDPAVSELEQMLRRLLRSGGVHRRDARDPVGRRLHRVDDDERVVTRLQLAQLRLRLRRQHQDRAVGRLAHEVLEHRDLAVVLVERGAEDDAHVLFVERLRRAAQDRAEVGVGDHRQRQPDEAGPAAAERPGAAVPVEAVLADDLQHRSHGCRGRRRGGR